jgi:Ca-activated chloride channel family protein
MFPAKLHPCHPNRTWRNLYKLKLGLPCILILRRTPLLARIFALAILATGLLLLGWGLSSSHAAASQSQGRAPDPRSSIRVDVNLVNVIASVLDKQNRPAVGLTRDQFEIYEEGKQQKLEVFEPETQQPLDLALMMDASLSEMKELQFQTEAAARFIKQVVRPGDRLAVFEFADAITQLSTFSDDVPRLQNAVRHISPGDGTALYDAVFLGAGALGRGPSGRRRVLVLLTDAGETTSRSDFETARRAALRAGTLLYTIVFRPVKSEGGRNTAGEHALATITENTGGAMLYPDDASQLNDMFDRIDRELRTQYRLGYYPQPRPPGGVYRQIEVRVKGDYAVRYRKSYYTGGPAE